MLLRKSNRTSYILQNGIAERVIYLSAATYWEIKEHRPAKWNGKVIRHRISNNRRIDHYYNYHIRHHHNLHHQHHHLLCTVKRTPEVSCWTVFIRQNSNTHRSTRMWWSYKITKSSDYCETKQNRAKQQYNNCNNNKTVTITIKLNS